MKRIAVIFAGGVGARMKNSKTPKQFLEWNGRPILNKRRQLMGLFLPAKQNGLIIQNSSSKRRGYKRYYPLWLVVKAL